MTMPSWSPVAVAFSLLVLAAPASGSAAECRNPGIYGRSLDAISQCRPRSAWTWLSFFEESAGQQTEDLRSFVCLEGLRGADAEVAREMDVHCRDYGAREMAPLAADPARAVGKVSDLVASFAWSVQPGGQVARDLWGEGGVISAFMDKAAFSEFRDSRGNDTWKAILEEGVEQVPLTDGDPVSSLVAAKEGEVWHWRHVRSLKFVRIERDQPRIGAAALPPPRLKVMGARVQVTLEGRFDPGWAGDANPLGVVVEKYEERMVAGPVPPAGRK